MPFSPNTALRWGVISCFLVLALSPWDAAASGLKVYVRFALPSGELQPLPGATVSVQPPEPEHPIQSFTGDDGSVEFASVPRGDCVVLAEMDGFKAIRKRVTVPASGTLRV